MEPVLSHVAAILARHPSPAMPLAELIRHLHSDGPGVVPSEDALLRALARDQVRFRVVRAAPGMRSLGSRIAEPEPAGASYWSGTVAPGPWIIGAPGSTPSRRPRFLTQVRAALAHLGRCLDEGSAAALARWLGMLAECGRLGEGAQAAAATAPDAVREAS